MCPQCPHDVPTIAPLVLMQQHLCQPGPGPTTLLGWGQVLVTPPARAERPDTAVCSVHCQAVLLPPGLEHKEPSGKAVKHGPRCSTPSVPPQRKWTGMVSSGCFSQPQDTWFTHCSLKTTSSKETLAQGPGFFTEPFTITRACTLDRSLSIGMQNPCFFPHLM